jgi:cyclohexanone monooxygenase
VPHVGAAAKHLYVFQRTPSSIDVRANRSTDPAWAASLAPGWQRRRMDNFNNLVSGIPEPEDLVHDGWTDIIGKLLLRLRSGEGDAGMSLLESLELADFEKMEQIRARVDEIVADPNVGEALKPYYRQFCKRPCFHDEYLQTFNRPNVTLVDTDGKGVERITPRGVVVAGREYPLDCLIYATGFEVGTDYTRRAGYEVHGVDGTTLTTKWRDGASTFHGFHSRGFPNCFVVSIVQSGFSVNFPHMLDEQAKHLGYLLAQARDRKLTRIETSRQAVDDWVQTIINLSMMNMQFLESCTPGYYNNEGNPAARSARDGSYGAGSPAFIRVLEDWRASGDLAGLEVS